MGFAFAVAVSAPSCQDGYPIAATQCDEWCDASRPFICSAYDPAGCVLTCQQRGGDAPQCQAEFEVLRDCLRNHLPNQDTCSPYGTEPSGPCPNELGSFAACAALYAKDGYGTLNW